MSAPKLSAEQSTKEQMSVCDKCSEEIRADDVAPACDLCGVDGLCADCAGYHDCDWSKKPW